MISLKGNRVLRIWKMKWLEHQNNSNNGSSEVAEEANVDEAVTAEAKASNDVEIDPKEEQKTQAYK